MSDDRFRAAVAAGVAGFLGRDKVADRLPFGGRDDSPVTPAPPPPPQPSNYDAPGPVANTATPIPAPDPHGEPPAHIDEAAEEAAAGVTVHRVNVVTDDDREYGRILERLAQV